MKMGSDHQIETINHAEEMYICPNCKYTDGFHVSFELEKNSGSGEIILICPSCHRRFRVGFKVTLKG